MPFLTRHRNHFLPLQVSGHQTLSGFQSGHQSRRFLEGVLWGTGREGQRAGRKDLRPSSKKAIYPGWLAGLAAKTCRNDFPGEKAWDRLELSIPGVGKKERRRLNYLLGKGRGWGGFWRDSGAHLPFPLREDSKEKAWVHFALEKVASKGVFRLLCRTGGGEIYASKRWFVF